MSLLFYYNNYVSDKFINNVPILILLCISQGLLEMFMLETTLRKIIIPVKASQYHIIFL